jgi:hypothetical protein
MTQTQCYAADSVIEQSTPEGRANRTTEWPGQE